MASTNKFPKTLFKNEDFELTALGEYYNNKLNYLVEVFQIKNGFMVTLKDLEIEKYLPMYKCFDSLIEAQNHAKLVAKGFLLH